MNAPIRLLLPLLLLPALPGTASGQSTGGDLAGRRAQVVAETPKGAPFRSSGQEYRLLVGIRAADVGRTGSPAARLAAAGAAGSDLIERKGPYAIYREPAGPVASGRAGTREVAVNTRTGRLGVVTGTITGRVDSVARAEAAAKSAGVQLEFVAKSTGYAFFRVPAGGDVLAATARIRAAPGLTEVQAEVRESFAEPE